MLKTPEYLSLLVLIKQLFGQQEELTEQKEQLIEWAQRVKLLQLQSVGDGVSATLVSDLEQQLPQMIVLAVELSQQDISPTLIEALQKEIEGFYQQIKQIDKTYNDGQLLENWQESFESDQKEVKETESEQIIQIQEAIEVEQENQTQEPEQEEQTQEATQVKHDEQTSKELQSNETPVLNEVTFLNANATEDYESHIACLFE